MLCPLRKILIASTATLLLASCAGGFITATDSKKIQVVLTQLGNTLTSDLLAQRAVALAATPPDVDGAMCAGTQPTNPADPTTGHGRVDGRGSNSERSGRDRRQ